MIPPHLRPWLRAAGAFGSGLPAALGRRACAIETSTAPARRRRQARRRCGVWHPGRCRPSCRRPRRMRSTSTGRRSNSHPTSSGTACGTRHLGGGRGSPLEPPRADMALGRSTNPVGMPCATQAPMGSCHELAQPRRFCDSQHPGGKSTNIGSSTRRRRRHISTGLLRGCSRLCRMHRCTTCSTGRADTCRAQQRLLPHTVRRPLLLSLHRQICSRCAMLLSFGKRL